MRSRPYALPISLPRFQRELHQEVQARFARRALRMKSLTSGRTPSEVAIVDYRYGPSCKFTGKTRLMFKLDPALPGSTGAGSYRSAETVAAKEWDHAV